VFLATTGPGRRHRAGGTITVAIIRADCGVGRYDVEYVPPLNGGPASAFGDAEHELPVGNLALNLSQSRRSTSHDIHEHQHVPLSFLGYTSQLFTYNREFSDNSLTDSVAQFHNIDLFLMSIQGCWATTT